MSDREDDDSREQSGAHDATRELAFADLLTPERETPSMRPLGTRPSFFPEETVEQSKGFADALLPSLRPGAPTKSHSLPSDSGLYDTDGLRTSADGESQDEISSVVLLHTREDEDVADSSSRSSRPGLISSLLGQTRALADEGAIAAWRTVPLRRRRDTRLPLVGDDPDARRARAQLLAHLAERSSGAVRARLLCGAADASTQLGDGDAARAALHAAFEAAPFDPSVLDLKLRDATLNDDAVSAAQHFSALLALPLAPSERALAGAAVAELTFAHDDPTSARAALDAARAADPESLLVELLRAELTWKSGERREAAEILTNAADLAQDAALRAALTLIAARAFERGHEWEPALAAYARTSAANPASRAGSLGAYRTLRASGQLDAAQAVLGTLAELCSDDPRLAAELTRQRARLLHEVLDRPEQALTLLNDAQTVIGLRAKARAAEACGNGQARMEALQAWADQGGGVERALALIEMAFLYAERQERNAAEQTLHDAALAGAPRALLGLLREALARADQDVAGLSAAALDEDATDTLRAAAKLARDPAEAARELSLLARARSSSGGALCAEVLTIDAAAELGELDALQSALARTSARFLPSDRLGPLLARLELLRATNPDAAARLEDELLGSAETAPIALRKVARTSEPTRAAELWLAEAGASEGERAAFAATMAGRYLEDAGVDPLEAYAEALDAVRGYAPACHALEVAMRRQGDLLALERVHRELSSTTPSRLERASRRVRLALLAAEPDPQAALSWLDQAAEDRDDDILLAELALRVAADSSADERADRMRHAATIERTPGLARAMQLRAAAAAEQAGRWQAALALYDALLERAHDADRDPIAAIARAHAARCAGRWDELITRTERAIFAAADAATRGAALETLADLELQRGDPARAAIALETRLESHPNDVATLRTLERLALDDADLPRTLIFAARLAELIADEDDRAAELTLAIRVDAQLGQDGAETLISRAEGTITHDLGFARALEALALRSGDRVRFYDAARAIADNLEGATQKAAYAVRAAEAFEAAAPARAASDLEALLLAAPEHPLAFEELARLYKAANAPADAAEMFRRAAAHAPSDRRRVQLLYAAGTIFHDELGDRDAAIETLSGVTALDVLYADAFERMRRLLAARGDQRALLALLGRRLSAKAEPAQVAQLETERAELHERLGERSAAKAALARALAAEPTHAAALRTLAQWQIGDAEPQMAADTLVQLARVTQDPELLAFAFFALGELYDGPLPDERRAEIAFTRVVSLAPDDARPIERLVALWTRRGDHLRAARALAHLIENTDDAARRERYIVALSEAQSALGDARLAEKTLEDARHATPGSITLLRALTALYSRLEDRSALAMHLVRTCHGLRGAIEVDPAQRELWQELVYVLEARGRHDGAALVAHAARALGHVLETAEPITPIRGLGSAALADMTLRKLIPRASLDAARAFFRELPANFAEFLPADQVEHAEPIAADALAVRAVAELLDQPSFSLLACDASLCMPIADQPPTVLISRSLLEAASPAEAFFLLTRAAVLATQGLSLLVRANPERLLLFAHALIQIENPRHSLAAIDMDELNALAKRLQDLHTPELAAALAPRLAELQSEGDWNPRRVAAQAWELGSRVALCASGDTVAAFEALLLLRGHDRAALTAEDRAALAKSDPALRALLSFALSEAYLELRSKG